MTGCSIGQKPTHPVFQREICCVAGSYTCLWCFTGSWKHCLSAWISERLTHTHTLPEQAEVFSPASGHWCVANDQVEAPQQSVPFGIPDLVHFAAHCWHFTCLFDTQYSRHRLALPAPSPSCIYIFFFFAHSSISTPHALSDASTFKCQADAFWGVMAFSMPDTE